MSAYTAEDFARNEAYAARARALQEELEAPDVASYLAGLKMLARLGPPAAADMTRVAQLEQKTNQFNTTTRRYSEAALAEFIARPDAIVLAFRLADRFGDHGLVSTLIAVQEGETLRIDSWLMSCRVFSRSAEAFILQRLIAMARPRGVKRLIGEYRPTAKNGVVADLYPRYGFTPIGDDGALWERDISTGDVSDLETFIAEEAAEAAAIAAE
jgi:FkbH-like protein